MPTGSAPVTFIPPAHPLSVHCVGHLQRDTYVHTAVWEHNVAFGQITSITTVHTWVFLWQLGQWPQGRQWVHSCPFHVFRVYVKECMKRAQASNHLGSNPALDFGPETTW